MFPDFLFRFICQKLKLNVTCPEDIFKFIFSEKILHVSEL